MGIWGFAERQRAGPARQVARRVQVVGSMGIGPVAPAAPTRYRPDSSEQHGPRDRERPAAPALDDYCRELRLPAIRRAYPALMRQAAEEGWTYETVLLRLLAAEVESRRRRSIERLLREARFPGQETLDQLDWGRLRGVDRAQVTQLASGDYLDRAEDVVITGPVGTGKTHIAIALGREAARQRRPVAFRRASDLVSELLAARDAPALARVQQRYRRVALLIIDELGFGPLDPAGRAQLFDLLIARSRRRSTIVTTHLALDDWAPIFGDPALASALSDRLGQHAHLINTRGLSQRARLVPGRRQ
jgi:DNA replication protein DnaC